MKDLVYFLIAFALGYFLSRQMGNGFSVGYSLNDDTTNINCINICNKLSLSENIICDPPSKSSWKQYKLYYKTRNTQLDETELYRNIEYYYNKSNNKTIIYLGGTFEQDDKYDNIFCKYKDDKKYKYGSTNGGYFYRNKCINQLKKTYNIIQLPQITNREIQILTKNGFHDKCLYKTGSDLSEFWYVYNNLTPDLNSDKNNVAERYNYDICGLNKNDSPDKRFIESFFKDSKINNLVKNKKIFIGGYSGGAYMTGRIIYESIIENIKWEDNTRIKFDGSFILSGTLFHCISPWNINNQYCPSSVIENEHYINTNINQQTEIHITEDFYTNKDQIIQHPPTIFFSPEYDDVVRKDQVRYYYDILNKYNTGVNKIIIPINEKIKHQWFGKTTILYPKSSDIICSKEINMNDYIKTKSNGMCHEIKTFFDKL